MIAPIDSTDTKVRWTSADLELFPDTGDRYEIIDGDLYVTRAPHARHQKVITRLCRVLPLQNAEGEDGDILTTPGFVFANDDNVIPDLVWISQAKIDTDLDESGHFTTAPELAVEVVSKARKDITRITRDHQIKLKLYSRVGVQEYWIIDWKQQTIEIYRRSHARLELVFTLYPEDELTSPLFADFKLKVAELFT